MANRPAVRLLIPFGMGVIIAWFIHIPLWFLQLVLVLIAILTIVAFRIMPQIISILTFVSLCFLGQLKITQDSRNLEPDNVAHFVGVSEEVQIDGELTDLPRVSERWIRFVLEAKDLHIGINSYAASGGVAVSLRNNTDTRRLVDSLTYGRMLSVSGMLQDVGDARNPGEFDVRRFLALNDIFARIRVDSAPNVLVRSLEGGNFLSRAVVPLRTSIASRIEMLVGKDEAQFLKGLLVGERSELPEETKTSFINAGTMHILAVSGLHVAIVTLMLLFLFRMFRLPEAAAIIVTCLTLVYYIFLTGGTASVARSVIMAIIILSARLFELKSDIYNTLAVSALIILLFDARQLFQPGFQLSYAAVLSIVYLYPRIDRVREILPERLSRHWTVRAVVAALGVSIAAGIGTIPFTSYYFGKVSIIGFLANLVAVPLSNLVLAVGMLAVALSYVWIWLASFYADATGILTRWLVQVVEYFGSLPLAYAEVRFSFVDSAIFYAGLFIVLNLVRREFRSKAVILVLVGLNGWLYLSMVFFENRAPLRVTFLDVGQGDAAFVQFPSGENLLIDAGPKSLTFDAGKRFVYPFLQWSGVTHVNRIVVSHPHSDHLGGILFLLRHIRIDEAVDAGSVVQTDLSREYHLLIDSLRVENRIVHSSDLLTDVKDVRLYILHPDSSAQHHQQNINNQSIVVKLVYGATSLLLVGDAESGAEEMMVHRYGTFLKSDLLKVGHHGSRTSSTLPFLTLVSPDVAAISVGERNKFRHPSPDIIDRLEELGCVVQRTDLHGALVFESDGRKWRSIDWR